jgi:hypothetical protein
VIASRRLEPRATLTRRPLPERDETIARLSIAERRVAAATWHGRAESELRAAGSFAHVAVTLGAVGAAPDLIALAHRAISDELRHATLCHQVATAFAGRALPPPRRLPATVPRHADASPGLRRILHVVGMCCLNETTGSAFLETCRAGARAPLASRALHELLADEIDHARIGWALISAADAETRDALARWLPHLLAANLAAWRRRPRRAITAALVEHGCPHWDTVDDAVVAAIDDLLLPGFALLGVDIAPARAWLARNRSVHTASTHD